MTSINYDTEVIEPLKEVQLVDETKSLENQKQ